MFEKYYVFGENANPDAIKLADEAFGLFKSLFNLTYGSIEEDDNLISIHTGGWSDNEGLITEFRKTSWWFLYHKISAAGGHYYFNTDRESEKEWAIMSSDKLT